LLYEVQGQAFLELYNAFVKDVTATDPLKRLEQVLHSYINFGFEHPDLYDLMFILRAPMNAVDDNNDWPNCDEAYHFLTDIMEKCIDQLRFENAQLGALSIWGLGHGLISLFIRERIKVTQLPDDKIRGVIMATANEHLRLIRK